MLAGRANRQKEAIKEELLLNDAIKGACQVTPSRLPIWVFFSFSFPLSKRSVIPLIINYHFDYYQLADFLLQSVTKFEG